MSIPDHIQEIINEVAKEVATWPADIRKEFFLTPYLGNSFIQYHHTLGRVIRNKYNLWQMPWEPEIIDGVDCSPYHPDQLSYTIIEEVWKQGNAKTTI